MPVPPMDFSSDNTLVYVALGLTAIYLIARILIGFRVRIRRPGASTLAQADMTAFQADARELATALETSASAARALADETVAVPDAPLDIPCLDFRIPARFRGDIRKLEKLPAPCGPLAALAARKAQTLQYRLFDKNWEPAQRREGSDTPSIYRRLGKDFETAAAQARRLERLLQEERPSPVRSRLAAKRRP